MPPMAKPRTLTVGDDGWCQFTEEPGLQTVFVRFAEADDRLAPVELYVSPGPITTDSLRRLPLGLIEVWANEPRIASSIRQYLSWPMAGGPDALMAHFGDEGNHRTLKKEHVVGPTVGRLRVPKARPYPDGFYSDVADAYTDLAAARRDPTATIAERSKVPLSAAQRWVRVAREKQFLPPPQHGKRG
jgi:hypothetical protein